MEPIANPFFANLFFHLFDTAKLDPRGTLCLFRRHARANVFLDQHFEVGIDFLVEVSVHTFRGEEITQETSAFCKEWHARLLSTVVPTELPSLFIMQRDHGIDAGGAASWNEACE